MDQQYKSILTNIATKSDAEEVSSCIDAILTSFYQARKLDYKKIIDKSLSTGLAETFKGVIDIYSSSEERSDESRSKNADSSQQARTINNSDKITGFLTSLKDKIQKLKVIKLTIAFSPTPDCIKTVSAFIKEKFGEEFIVDIEQDPKILGGAIIALDGKYQDLTLKKALDEVFEKKKAEIISFIK